MEPEPRFYRLVRPLIPKPLRPLVLKYRELLSYLVFGVLTTLVNFLIYFPLKEVMPYWVANIPAWIGAVAFAFFTNKYFVFEDDNWERGHLLRQGARFASMRLVSLGLEELILLIFVEKLGLNENITKVVAQAVVILSNYVFSKLLIFRKK